MHSNILFKYADQFNIYIYIFFFLQGEFFRANLCWGLVRGRRQSWLTNGQGWTKAWRGSIWRWLPSDKLTPLISTAIVKLMSYGCNRLRWLEKTAARGERGLDWDRRATAGRGSAFPLLVQAERWSTCVSLGSSGTMCVGFTWVELSLTQTLMTKLGGGGGGSETHFCWSGELQRGARNGTENVLVQMSLRGEITMVKSKIIVLQQL